MSGREDDESPAASSASDRRAAERHAAAVVTMLEIDGVERSALLRDLSVTGAMCLCRAKPEAGTPIRLHICIDGDRDDAIVLEGTVLRWAQWLDGGSHWPFSIAIRLDSSAEAHIDRIRAIGERQAAQGLLSPKS